LTHRTNLHDYSAEPFFTQLSDAPAVNSMDDYSEVAEMVAKLMAAAAKTAPKGMGKDFLDIRILGREDCVKLGEEMIRWAAEGRNNFDRDGKNVRDADALLLVGLKDQKGLGLECGACGYACAEMSTTDGKDFKGPNCGMRVLDMGIALGSAVKTAQLHNADNRIMYRAGAAARKMGYTDANLVMGVPISFTGKSPYFDR